MPPDPHPTASERILRKRQARLDDNGKPAGVPALKKMKSVEKNVAKKTYLRKQDPKRKTILQLHPKRLHPLKYQRRVAQMLQRTPMQQL